MRKICLHFHVEAGILPDTAVVDEPFIQRSIQMNFRGKFLVGASLGLMVGLGITAVAQEVPGTPSEPDATATEVKGRIISPYNMLNDLTDDQKSKIVSIHLAELDAQKALVAKEREDIRAVLTPVQVRELAAAIDKSDAEKKAAAEKKKAEELKAKADALINKANAATQPGAK
jgi:Spy/CpxP family protein refolding chaperone